MTLKLLLQQSIDRERNTRPPITFPLRSLFRTAIQCCRQHNEGCAAAELEMLEKDIWQLRLKPGQVEAFLEVWEDR